jgi:NADH-quinone oxidoreductase subunit L
MELNNFLSIFVLIPFIGIILASFSTNKQEKYIFGVAAATVGLHLACGLVFTVLWLAEGAAPLFDNTVPLYDTGDNHFSIDFFFDKATMIYGMVTSAITIMVMMFSRYYMHRDPGYRRFFINVLMFYFGINIILFSGNFETLFVGWEVIGIASFFLIAYYRDRYLPVKNALKVISYYRLADVFFLLAIWACHHAFHQSLNFLSLSNLPSELVEHKADFYFRLFVPAFFLIVAMVKSAQYPFSSWLPRAMEGPTTSSAIFYGSLSVHMGVFLMIRTSALWEDNLTFRILMICIGVFAMVVCTLIARVQSSVKTQIAYSSISQIGLMFVWVAMGWHTVALIHFALNAFLRTYQLLVSPSVLSYRIHDQFFNFIKPSDNYKGTTLDKIKLSIYILSIKEFNMDNNIYNLMWQPIKRIGNAFSFISRSIVFYAFIPLFLGGLFLAYNKNLMDHALELGLPTLFAIIGIIMALKAFVERGSSSYAWFLVILNQLFTSLAIAFNEEFDYGQIHIFLSGIIISGIVGYICLKYLKSKGVDTKLDGFKGNINKYQTLALVFLISCLGIVGFPITPTFIGEDVILGHIHENQYLLTFLIALGLIVDGLAIFRIYARIFLGPNRDSFNEVAYRSS